MKGDFTRFTFRPQKHYRNVNHQQGRVGLDADWNEQAEIAAYRDETEAQDVIGPAGAPKHKAGFAITPASGNGDFTIGAGRFYVDGIVCENDDPILFSKQPDLPGFVPLPSGHRYLVYLDVWQRHLTALDDPEIREVALGGPDTATRTKIVWQVRAFDVGNVGANVSCATDVAPWTNAVSASTGKLRARAMPDAQSDKPCIVPPGAGYRRLENQFYRVEIHAAGSLGAPGVSAPTFKWSRENGSVVAGISSITGPKITLTSFRRDSALGFAPGNWIEITDAGQELRGEPGVLVQINAVDDLVLTLDPTSAIGTLPVTLTPSDLALLPRVRRWDSAGVVTATVPSTNDGFLALEDGVEVKFEAGSYRSGDYWMFPARTDKGTVEWPQDKSGALSVPAALLPFGIRHHFCRLAIIEVKAGVVTLVEDCRHLFPPLTELEDCCGCCTKTVGETDAADYRKIQEAVDSLPATGGQICVLDGSYLERVVIANRRDIIIIGCGRRSRLSPLLENGAESGPIIQIEKSVNIRLEKLFFAQGLRSAVAVMDSEFVTIFDCEVAMTAQTGSEPALFFQCNDGLIERNVIAWRKQLVSGPVLTTGTIGLETGRVDGTQSSSAASTGQVAGSGNPASGIQLAGGCHRVRVLENWIYQVPGQGITFGHLEEAPLPVSSPTLGGIPTLTLGRTILGRWTSPDDPCANCNEITNKVPIHPSDSTPQPTHQIISPESLWDIHIERNRIESAGLDGIGVIGFFDLSKVDEFVRVRDLTILGNEITDCLNLPHGPIAADWVDSMGYGGIALADVSELVVHDNVIERNGAQRDQPVCGIFVLHGDGIDIERNRILGNGYQPTKLLPAPQAIPQLGRRGGIQIVYALAPVAQGASVGTKDPAGKIQWSVPLNEATGFPAFKLHDNIVSAPLGPALSVVALGPVSVVGNQLTSGHVLEEGRSRVFGPATVFIFNLGVSSEIYSQQISLANMSAQPPPPVSGLDDRNLPRLANGNVLFTDNQCSLDLLEPGNKFLLTSLVLASLDDIGFLNNQCDCNLRWEDPPIVAHAFLLSPSVRVIGNRFKEGVFNAAYSAIITGILNITAHNESTHCLQVNGYPPLTQDGPNIIFANNQCQPGLEDTWNRLIALRNQL